MITEEEQKAWEKRIEEDKNILWTILYWIIFFMVTGSVYGCCR